MPEQLRKLEATALTAVQKDDLSKDASEAQWLALTKRERSVALAQTCAPEVELYCKDEFDNAHPILKVSCWFLYDIILCI